MKKLILLLLIFIFLAQFTFAICCETKDGKEGGCYPDDPICCIEENKNVGYVGCPTADFSNNKCPGEFFGSCLKCSETCKQDGTNCNWEEVLDACEPYDCLIEYFPETKIPLVKSECSASCDEGKVMVDGECIDQNKDENGDLECYDYMCITNKFCCKKTSNWLSGSFNIKFEEGEGALCSGDNDNDEICNYYDNCPKTSNPNQEDSNEDGIGDACEFEGTCESPYIERQCCDDLPGAKAKPEQISVFYGFTPDCLGPIGCWSACVGTDEQGYEITYEVGPCIDGIKTIRILQNGVVIEIITESCSTIPLIPFFTNFNLLITFLILFLFYFIKER